jgi:hypothetical protein
MRKKNNAMLEKAKAEKWNDISLNKILRLTLEKYIAKDKFKVKERQAEASIRKIERFEKTQDRRDETRRKIIVGALVLAEAGWQYNLKKLIEEKLTKPADRLLFDLPPKL